MTNENPSGIVPTEYNVLVQPEDSEVAKDYESKGFIVPDEVKARHSHTATIGSIIAVSEKAFSYEDSWDRKPQVGDRVAFAKFTGMSIKGKDGEAYKLIKDKDVTAILEF